MKAVHKNHVIDVRMTQAPDGRTAIVAYKPEGEQVLAYFGSLGLDWLGWNDGKGHDFKDSHEVLDFYGYIGVEV